MKDRIKAFFETADGFDFIAMVILGLVLVLSAYSMFKSDIVSGTFWVNTIAWLILFIGGVGSLLVERNSLMVSLTVVFGLLFATNQIFFWTGVSSPIFFLINAIVSLILILLMMLETSPRKVFDRGG